MKPQIMAPAGSFKTLQSAIKAGADAVYFGVGNLNMRSRSANFTIDDLKEIIDICKKNNVISYLCINTVLYDEDLQNMHLLCNLAKKHGVSAIIASDIAVIQYAISIGLTVHASTQLNISNIEAVKYFSKHVDALVLARELTLDQIKSICAQVKEQNITGPSGELVKIEIM